MDNLSQLHHGLAAVRIARAFGIRWANLITDLDLPKKPSLAHIREALAGFAPEAVNHASLTGFADVDTIRLDWECARSIWLTTTTISGQTLDSYIDARQGRKREIILGSIRGMDPVQAGLSAGVHLRAWLAALDDDVFPTLVPRSWSDSSLGALADLQQVRLWGEIQRLNLKLAEYEPKPAKKKK